MFFFSLFFYWRIIALQCCFSSCWTTKWISYMYAYVPSFLSLPPTITFPIPPLQVIREQQAELRVLYTRCPLASCLTHGTLSVHPTLPFPHCVTYPFSTSASLFLVNFFLNIPTDFPSIGVLFQLVWGVARTWALVLKVLRSFSQQPTGELLCHETQRRGCWVQTSRTGEAHRAGHVCAGPSEAVWDWGIIFGVVMYTWNKIQKFKRISLDRLIFLFLLGPCPVLLSGANTLSSSCLYQQRQSTQLSIRNLSVW